LEEIMSIFSRVFRLCKADLHGVMDQLEDKALLLKQCLREMEESLKHKEARLDRIDRAGEQIRRALDRHNEESIKLEQDLELAVGKEKDEIARMLIRKRRTLQGGCSQLQRQLEALTEERGQVAETMEKQRLQYDQLKVKTAAFCRQAEHHRYEEPLETLDGAFAWQTPSEEEIELELLQRKEAARKGGGS
jgi:phage shock protein A